MTLEISKLIKFSLRQNAIFQKLNQILHLIMKNQVFIHYAQQGGLFKQYISLQSVMIANFAVLQELWDEAPNVSTDSEP